MEIPYGFLSQLLLLGIGGITALGGLALVLAFFAMGRSAYRKD